MTWLAKGIDYFVTQYSFVCSNSLLLYSERHRSFIGGQQLKAVQSMGKNSTWCRNALCYNEMKDIENLGLIVMTLGRILTQSIYSGANNVNCTHRSIFLRNALPLTTLITVGCFPCFLSSGLADSDSDFLRHFSSVV